MLKPLRMTGDEVTSFAVRFHFWAARLFLDLNLRDLYNQVWDLELVQPDLRLILTYFFITVPWGHGLRGWNVLCWKS